MKYVYCLMVSFAVIFLSACTGSKVTATDGGKTTLSAERVEGRSTVTGSGPHAMMPKAVIYKTNGDYNDQVFVNTNAGTIVSYPAPSDVSAASAPIALGDGWLLDRRGGINGNSAFTTYTYSQYAALPKAPSIQQLKESIIPEARVTEIMALPITASEAIADPDLVKKYIPKK